MDPIEPIRPSVSPTGRVTGVPVERLERVSRERDRPSRERSGSRRRPYRPPSPRRPADGEQDGPEDDRPHVDVRA